MSILFAHIQGSTDDRTDDRRVYLDDRGGEFVAAPKSLKCRRQREDDRK